MLTFVRYLSCVLPYMNLKLTSCDAGEGTHFTLVRLFTCVIPHMDPDTI